MPNVLVNLNSKSMIQPRKLATGPRKPPSFVKTTAPTKPFKTLPPYGYTSLI